MQEAKFQAAIKQPQAILLPLRSNVGPVKITGNPSEVALLRFVENVTSTKQLRDEYEIVFEIPFNSVRKWHLMIGRKLGGTSNSDANDDGTAVTSYTVMMKGAPEVLIEKCGFYAGENGIVAINDAFKLDFQDAYLHFGNEGKQCSRSLSVVFSILSN